jgi:hypothetical protein
VQMQEMRHCWEALRLHAPGKDSGYKRYTSAVCKGGVCRVVPGRCRGLHVCIQVHTVE